MQKEKNFFHLFKCFVLAGLFLQASTLVGSELEYPFIVHEKGKTQEMQLLHSGVSALAKRIEMVRGAKDSIELETFIYTPDHSGKALMIELIKKAKSGVKVKLLLDKSITVIQFDEYYAKIAAEHKIEVRYYRRAIDPSSAQFRNHRKLLVVDGKEAILGGRNIGDEYFDLHESYNYHDRDMWVKGPIVRAMRDSFYTYWNSNVTIEPPTPQIFEYSRLHRSQRRRDPRHATAMKRYDVAREFMKDSEENQQITKKVMSLGLDHLKNNSSIYACRDAMYVTDRPGGKANMGINSAEYKNHYRLLGQVLKREASLTKESLDFETPYWILNSSWEGVLFDLVDQKKNVSVFTNSLGATDAVYVSTAFYQKVYEYMDRGIVSIVHPAKWIGNDPYVFKSTPTIRYGVHSKSWLRDHQQVLISSYNMDNRSDYYNNELAIICNDSKGLADDLWADMLQRRLSGYRVVGNEMAVREDGKQGPADIYGGADEAQIRLMKKIRLPVEWFEGLL